MRARGPRPTTEGFAGHVTRPRRPPWSAPALRAIVRAHDRRPTLGPAQPSASFRWLVLLACSVAMFGNYYVFDALYPVTPFLQEQLGFTDQQIGLLDTAYNVAALITLIGGGILIDRLGTARSAVLFGAVGAAGSALIAFLPAAMPGSPALAMAAGRFVLGVGSELFIVAATTVVGRWFKGREIYAPPSRCSSSSLGWARWSRTSPRVCSRGCSTAGSRRSSSPPASASSGSSSRWSTPRSRRRRRAATASRPRGTPTSSS